MSALEIIMLCHAGVNTDRQFSRSVIIGNNNKTAELSQRRPRDAPNIWVPRKILRILTSPRLLFPKFVMGIYSDRY